MNMDEILDGMTYFPFYVEWFEEEKEKEVELTSDQEDELNEYLLEGYYWDKYIQSYGEYDR